MRKSWSMEFCNEKTEIKFSFRILMLQNHLSSIVGIGTFLPETCPYVIFCKKGRRYQLSFVKVHFSPFLLWDEKERVLRPSRSHFCRTRRIREIVNLVKKSDIFLELAQSEYFIQMNCETESIILLIDKDLNIVQMKKLTRRRIIQIQRLRFAQCSSQSEVYMLIIILRKL